MRIDDFYPIFEGRDAPLYHGTTVQAAALALTSDRILPKTTQVLPGWKDVVNGVSLSRNLAVSKRFGPIVFVLNQSKLAMKHRMVPVDYYSSGTYHKEFSGDDDPEFVRRRGSFAEAEEFLIGGISNLSRYLDAIMYFKPGKIIFGNVPSLEDYPIIANHPLLKVIG